MLQALVKKGTVVGEEVFLTDMFSIKTIKSFISPGTEMKNVIIYGLPLMNRALQQLKNVKKILESISSKEMVNKSTIAQG